MRVYTDKNGDKHFSFYSSYGSYPLAYLREQVPHCAYCACEKVEDREADAESFTAYPIFEGVLSCEECGEVFETAYDEA